MDDARRALAELGLPCVIRPAFTLGGTGGGIAYNVEEFETIAARGLALSMNSEVLVEEYLHAVSTTISAGSNEVQRNIIATRGLGLPRG